MNVSSRLFAKMFVKPMGAALMTAPHPLLSFRVGVPNCRLLAKAERTGFSGGTPGPETPLLDQPAIHFDIVGVGGSAGCLRR